MNSTGEEAGPGGALRSGVLGPIRCAFALMPFGRKSDATGTSADFDAVYEQLITPSIRPAELETGPGRR